jgi:hypothetical protein
MIMFHPEVKSQRKHSETTSRMVTYDVFLTMDVCRCWCSHVFCLNEKMVWRNVYAIVAKAYIRKPKLCRNVRLYLPMSKSELLAQH